VEGFYIYREREREWEEGWNVDMLEKDQEDP
jgi:hypothetical protein